MIKTYAQLAHNVANGEQETYKFWVIFAGFYAFTAQLSKIIEIKCTFSSQHSYMKASTCKML